MKEYSPSVERNRGDILEVLRSVLPNHGTILEIASGSGQHAIHFAPHFPGAQWQPTDRDPRALASIQAWSEEAALPNLRLPLDLDVAQPVWPVDRADAIVTINMLHISPFAACEALFEGAARVLSEGAPLFYYGAFIRADRETAASNLAFDCSLRERDPSWGIRQLEDVVAVAGERGFASESPIDMPNNNYAVVFRRRLN